MTQIARVSAVQQMSSDEDLSDIEDIKDELIGENGLDDSLEETSADEGIEDEVKAEFTEEGNTGMAAVMAKILNKEAPAHTSIIMSKSVSEKQLAARKKRHLENADPVGDVEVVKPEADSDIKSEPLDSESDRKKILKKRKVSQTAASIKLRLEREEMCHSLPDILDRSKELSLMKIATRGVVQLFNAVKQQQGNIKEKVSQVKSSIRKTDKVISEFTSGDFLDRLKSQKVRTIPNSNSAETGTLKDEVKDEPTWSALRDDFTMGAQSMKDWDKEVDEEEDGGELEGSEENPDTDSEGG